MDDLTKLEQGQNTGVVEPKIEELAKVSGIDITQFPILAPDGDNDQFLTDFQNGVFEPQAGVYFDTLGCNIFSSIHEIEARINAMGGDPIFTKNGKALASSRFAAKRAGLTGLAGSSEAQWENMILSDGVVREDAWPFPFAQRTPVFDRPNFFSDIEPQVLAEALSFYERWTPVPRNVGTSDVALREALKYGPVKIFVATGAGWNQGEPNTIPKTNNPMNHAIMLRKIGSDGSKYILDQYPPFLKKLAPDYVIFYAFQTLLIKKGQQRMLVFFQVKGNQTLWSLQDGEWVGFSELAAFNKYIDGRPFKVLALDQVEFEKIKANPDVYKL